MRLISLIFLPLLAVGATSCSSGSLSSSSLRGTADTASTASAESPSDIVSFLENNVIGRKLCTYDNREESQATDGEHLQLWDREATFTKVEASQDAFRLYYDVHVTIRNFKIVDGQQISEPGAETTSTFVYEARANAALSRYVGIVRLEKSAAHTTQGDVTPDTTALGTYVIKNAALEGGKLHFQWQSATPTDQVYLGQMIPTIYKYDELLWAEGGQLQRHWGYEQYQADPKTFQAIGEPLPLGANPNGLTESQADCK